jgi:acyl-coenzyme A synthetase/AMP-(fatty) acid ligase
MATLQNCDGVLDDLSRNGDRPAVFTLRKRGSETWSYADLDGCVDRLARGLRHAELVRGDRAAIIADNGPEWIAARRSRSSVPAVSSCRLMSNSGRRRFDMCLATVLLGLCSRRKTGLNGSRPVRKMRGSFCWTQQIKTSGVGGACF